jgi:hypothetical protein
MRGECLCLSLDTPIADSARGWHSPRKAESVELYDLQRLKPTAAPDRPATAA